jgi:Zn-dependent protease
LTTQAWPAEACPQCSTQLAPAMKACPGCGRLVHGAMLTNLAISAKEATHRGELTAALGAWREALELLPPGSRQHEVVSAKITELVRALPYTSPLPPAANPAKQNQSVLSRFFAAIGAVGLMLWKAKVLLLGLAKGTTFFSMLLSLAVYWSIWGWKFALGFVLSIYVHEMGHVIALRRYGFKASAPMFIPGLGALVRLQQQIVNPLEDAEIGLAGPIYGLGAALFTLVLWKATALPIFAAIAGVGAWINLFNLIPIGSLDGGRGFHALSQIQKLIVTAVVGGTWYYTQDPMLMLVGIVCLVRALGDKPTPQGSSKTTVTYALLVIALAAIAMLRNAAIAAASHSGAIR